MLFNSFDCYTAATSYLICVSGKVSVVINTLDELNLNTRLGKQAGTTVQSRKQKRSAFADSR